MALPPLRLMVETISLLTGAQHHLHHVHGGAVGDAHAVDEFRGDSELFQQLADLRAAAVHHDRVHAHQLHQHHVAGKALVQRRVDHGVAAKLDDHGLAGEALDIGQRLGEDLGDLQGGLTFEHLEPRFQIWLYLLELFTELRLDALQRVDIIGFEASDQGRCGVGGAQQAPAVVVIHPHAVDVGHLAGAEIAGFS